MCYAIPGKVKNIEERIVIVDYFGEEKRARNEIESLAVGDYIYAQGGYVIEKIPKASAESILSVWKETFFELQEVDLRLSKLDLDKENSDRKLGAILDKSLEGIGLKENDIDYLLKLEKPQAKELLYKTANFLRQKFHKNACCVHGIIEISNHCQCKCHYCGISAYNKKLSRYRMEPDEIISACIEAVEKYGFGALVLQSGQDPYYTAEKLAKIIREIKSRVGVLICISFGEVGIDNLAKLYQAGARGLLLRFETSNPELYKKFHPGQDLQTRLAHLKKADELGYLIITGGLIGLPGQNDRDIANDILLAKELNTEMYSFGPYLAHPDTLLAGMPPPTTDKMLKALALCRLVDPQKGKVLVTTAFETLDSASGQKALSCGASSLMLNITPLKYRRQYEIYPDKINLDTSIRGQINQTVGLLKSLGRAPTDLGATREIK